MPYPSASSATHSIRRRILGATAAASVCGLVLTLSLPAISPEELPDSAAGIVATQQLFSETTLDDAPSAFTTLAASDMHDPEPREYTFRPEKIVNHPFATPVTLTDGFGYRTYPVEQFHDAQDYAAASGTPIHAIADGVVIEAEFSSDGCGFGLKLEHELNGDEVTSRYCHMEMDSHDFIEGDIVTMGDLVGTVGNTGLSFGPHLHLAIRVNDEPIDPLLFFAEYGSIDREDDPSRDGDTSREDEVEQPDPNE